MYDYPLDPYWSTEEIIDVVSLYNAVEKAYEEGISQDEFMKYYSRFTEIVNSKSEQKRIDEEFYKVSGYSIYKVFQQSKEHDWIEIKW